MKTNPNKLLLLLALSLISISGIAQVGINKDNPDACAILQVADDTRGVILPQINFDSKLTIRTLSDGLLYYNTTQHHFRYYNLKNQTFQCVNPWDSFDGNLISTLGDVTIGKTLNIGGALSLGGNLDAGSNSITAGSFTGTGNLSINGTGSIGSTLYVSDVVSSGSNSWIFHSPDDARTSLYFAPNISGSWAWDNAIRFDNSGQVRMNLLGIGTDDLEGNTLNLASESSPFMKIKTSYAGFKFGIATADWNYSRYAKRGDVFFVSYGTHNFHFVLNDDNNDGNSSFQIHDNVKELFQVFNNGAVNIPGTLTVGGRVVSIFESRPERWADYVFEPNYKLMSIDTLKQYINKEKKLPNIISEKEAKSSNVNIMDMQVKLLEKIEELTLYMIEMKKEIETLKEENQTLKVLVAQPKN